MDELAINGDRILKTGTIKKEVTIIETTANKFKTGIVKDVGGNGGGQQYIFGPDFKDYVNIGG